MIMDSLYQRLERGDLDEGPSDLDQAGASSSFNCPHPLTQAMSELKPTEIEFCGMLVSEIWHLDGETFLNISKKLRTFRISRSCPCDA